MRRALVAFFLPAVVSSCSPQSVTPGARPAPTTTASPEWRYEVAAENGGAELAVRAVFPQGTSAELTLEDDAAPFVRDLALAHAGAWQNVTAGAGSTWRVPECMRAGCEIRYRFALAEAARSIHDLDTAIASERAFLAPPSTWLLRPLAPHDDGEERFWLHVTTTAPTRFVSGLTPVPGQAATFVGRASDLPRSPYSAFGELRPHTLSLGNGAQTLEMAFAGPELEIGDAALVHWVLQKAAVVAQYYGQFPVSRALILVLGSPGARFDFGKTLGNGGASIVLPMGTATPASQLTSDWVLVHEMMHLGFPNVGWPHRWLEEGMATYLEPIARARASDLAVEEVWRGLVEGLPQGLPEAGDAGLDRTHTWGRTYWGGALFCLLADVAIREQTHNERTLDHAIRGIVAVGGTVAEHWDIEQVIAVGDRATGTAVLADLYRKMSLDPFPVDLNALWKRLGIRRVGQRMMFEDAPLSYVRRAITAR